MISVPIIGCSLEVWLAQYVDPLLAQFGKPHFKEFISWRMIPISVEIFPWKECVQIGGYRHKIGSFVNHLTPPIWVSNAIPESENLPEIQIRTLPAGWVS